MKPNGQDLTLVAYFALYIYNILEAAKLPDVIVPETQQGSVVFHEENAQDRRVNLWQRLGSLQPRADRVARDTSWQGPSNPP